MISINNPNAWSCLPTAFAMALGVDLNYILKDIGHDGSEITHAGLPEPLNRRGFHMQELIKVATQRDHAVTPIELAPMGVPAVNSGGRALDMNLASTPKMFDTGHWDWFKDNLFWYDGVIECRKACGTGHAVASHGRRDHAAIHDPATGGGFTFREPSDAEERGLFFVTLWKLDDVEV